MENNYNSNNIEVLEGLSSVKKRPGMYIGSTDYRGLHHLIWEILDNAIDEVLNDSANEVVLTIHKDGSIEIWDNGRGIPIDLHPKGAYTPQIVFTILHAGGKFSGDNYKSSGGLHGVGSSVVNAMSKKFVVDIYRDKMHYHQEFYEGDVDIKEPIIENYNGQKKGTIVRFWPNPDLFSTTKFQHELIKNRVIQAAYLLPTMQVTLIDEIKETNDIYQFEQGISSYVLELNKDKKELHQANLFTYKEEEMEIDFSFQYTTSYSENIISFVNNINTKDGGTHVQGAKSAFTKAFNTFAKDNKLLSTRMTSIDGTDIREGLTLVISLRLGEKYLQFESQTKSKLGTNEAKGFVERAISTNLLEYLNQNQAIGKLIVEKAKKSAQAREAAKKARENVRAGKKLLNKGESILDKLTLAQTTKKEARELFLVEGDSAGGSAKQGRDRRIQAILPLRGKVLNTEKATDTQMLKNAEIRTLISAIGAGFGPDFDIKKSNYGKIILMTDADDDGAHIQILLMTFFYRYMTTIIESGLLYVALPPLYKIYKGKGKTYKEDYTWDDIGLEKLKSQYKSGYSVQRFKGLGEMNADELWETTMNPETRSLVQVTMENASATDHFVSVLMGDDVSSRREWIENNVDFEVSDEFEL